MPRLLFEKTGNAIWISHLDLMRVFQRSFKRAGLKLTHSHGFNPRPSVSIALPLSVGVESQCELLDFDLGEPVSLENVAQRLNEKLSDGIRVLSVYEQGEKIRELAYLRCSITLQYDKDLDEHAVVKIRNLFESDSLIVEKKTKSGLQDQNIIPMVRELMVQPLSDREIELQALICCQNPTLNPNQMVLAIRKYLPQYQPDFVRYKRIEIYNKQEIIFR